MKNNSYLLLFLSLLTLSSCRDKKAQKLFYNQALQDSLELYISQIQDICNPYNAPTILDIWINITSDFSGTERDTIIAMSAVYRISGPPGYSESFDGPIISYPCDVVGAGWQNGRMCVVKYIDGNIFPFLVNEGILTIPRKEFDFCYQYDGPSYDVRVSRSTRIYKLNGKEAVNLLEKAIGDFELQ